MLTRSKTAPRASSYAVAETTGQTLGVEHQKLAQVSPNYASTPSLGRVDREDYVKQMAVAARMLAEVQSMIVHLVENGPLDAALAGGEATSLSSATPTASASAPASSKEGSAGDSNDANADQTYDDPTPQQLNSLKVLKSGMAMIRMQSKLKTRASRARSNLSHDLQFVSASMRSGKDRIDIAKTMGEKIMTTGSGGRGKQTIQTTRDDVKKKSLRKMGSMKRRLSVGTLQAVGDIQKQARTSRMTAFELAEELSHRHTRPNFCMRTIIHPFNSLHTAWDCFVCVVLLVVLWMLPLTLAFEEIHEATSGLNLAIDIVFGLDLIKQFRTGFLTKDDFVVMDPKTIALTYLRGWFVIDFVSIFPIDTLVTAIVASGAAESTGGQTLVTRSTRSLKMLRLLRIAKLVRLMRVSRAFRYIRFFKAILEDKLHIEIPSSTIKLLRLFTVVILVCHWGACVNFFACRLYDFPPESWVAEAGVQNMPMTQKYGWCFLKAAGAVVKVGFGSNPAFTTSCDSATPWCEIETWMVFVQLFIGQVYYAILVAEISTILHNMDVAKRAYELRMNAANAYMRTKKLPSLLRDKIRDYMRARYQGGRMFDEAAVLASLSPPLKREVMAACASELKAKVPWLRDDPVLHARVSSIAEPILAVDGDVLIREGEIGHTVYIISQGVVELFRTPHTKSLFAGLLNKNAEPKFIKAIGDGCTFGAVSVVLGVRCSATAIAKGNVMLYAISKPKFNQLLKEFEVTQQYFLELTTLRKKKVEEQDATDNISVSEDEDTVFVDPEDAKTELFQLSMQLADQDHDIKSVMSAQER